LILFFVFTYSADSGIRAEFRLAARWTYDYGCLAARPSVKV
jgi:hypothetical protein